MSATKAKLRNGSGRVKAKQPVITSHEFQGTNAPLYTTQDYMQNQTRSNVTKGQTNYMADNRSSTNPSVYTAQDYLQSESSFKKNASSTQYKQAVPKSKDGFNKLSKTTEGKLEKSRGSTKLNKQNASEHHEQFVEWELPEEQTSVHNVQSHHGGKSSKYHTDVNVSNWQSEAKRSFNPLDKSSYEYNIASAPQIQKLHRNDRNSSAAAAAWGPDDDLSYEPDYAAGERSVCRNDLTTPLLTLVVGQNRRTKEGRPFPGTRTECTAERCRSTVGSSLGLP